MTGVYFWYKWTQEYRLRAGNGVEYSATVPIPSLVLVYHLLCPDPWLALVFAKILPFPSPALPDRPLRLLLPKPCQCSSSDRSLWKCCCRFVSWKRMIWPGFRAAGSDSTRMGDLNQETGTGPPIALLANSCPPLSLAAKFHSKEQPHFVTLLSCAVCDISATLL